MSDAPVSVTCLRARAVALKLGMSVPTVWRHARLDPSFPQPIRSGNKHTFWLESEVDAYVMRLVEKSRSPETAAA